MRHRHTGIMGIVLAMTLTGCWDRAELNELAITSATSIDRGEDNWMVSYQVIIPSSISGGGALGGGGGASSQTSVVVHSVTSKTIREAGAISHLETTRKLYYGHNSVLVISEKAAREGISPIIDIYLRNHEARETVSVLIAPGEARSILEQLMNMERIPGQGIQRLLEKEQKSLSYVPNVRIYELAMDMLGESKTGLLPEIEISGIGETTQSDKLKSTKQISKLKLRRLAVIHENKMIGWLSRDEVLGIAFLRNRVKGTSIPFSCSGKNSGEKESTFALTKSKSKIIPHLEGDSFSIRVEIKAKGILDETDCSNDLLKPEVIKQMENQIAKEIERTTLASWKATKRFKADVTGLSAIIMRKYPNQWDKLKKEKQPDWESMKLTVKADVKLDRVGLSNKSFKKMMEE